MDDMKWTYVANTSDFKLTQKPATTLTSKNPTELILRKSNTVSVISFETLMKHINEG